MPHAISISQGKPRCRFYAGNIELACRRGRYLNGQIQHIAFPDGRLAAEYAAGGASVTGYRSEYFRTDHLGNTRLTFSDFNQDGVISWKLPANGPSAQESEITSENHYYPFGLGQRGPWYASVAPENKYRYNGKEWNDAWGLNMYDYGARGYMPDLGRWGGVDPLAEKYYSIIPYHYTANNPIKFVDYDGKDYGIKIDHDNRIITIRAHFVANGANMNAVNQSVDFWNGQSGNFEYVIGKGDKAVSYQVNFELSAEEAKPKVTSTFSGDASILNFINISPDNAPIFAERHEISSNGEEMIIKPQGGSNGKNLTVKESQKSNVDFLTHEKGHNLGMNHTGAGRMNTAGSGDKLVPMNIRESLGHGGVGKGRSGTTTRAKVTTSSTGEAPPNFNSGKVKRVKN